MSSHPTSLLEIIEPLSNPWLQSVQSGKVRVLPQGVRIIRYQEKDVPDTEEITPPVKVKSKLAELAGA
ncbi:MAG: hypothetical protein EG825_14560 [Rhodocyclaceae bacterium]|nr:hypothetical protein [Rhodocyclaceae bacterium]